MVMRIDSLFPNEPIIEKEGDYVFFTLVIRLYDREGTTDKLILRLEPEHKYEYAVDVAELRVPSTGEGRFAYNIGWKTENLIKENWGEPWHGPYKTAFDPYLIDPTGEETFVTGAPCVLWVHVSSFIPPVTDLKATIRSDHVFLEWQHEIGASFQIWRDQEIVEDTGLYKYSDYDVMSQPGKHYYMIVPYWYRTYSTEEGWYDTPFYGTPARLEVTIPSTVPETGSIKFLSEPEGAEIFLDDTDLNIKTPAVVSEVSAGIHTYALKLRGVSISGEVGVIADETITVQETFPPSTGEEVMKGLLCGVTGAVAGYVIGKR